MGASILTGESDIARIMLKAGLGTAGLLIIIFSTVTTTFLDAYSAGVSFGSITKKLPEKYAAVIAAALGTIGAIAFPMDDITGFLYLIGSVFAPMIAIQIADFFLLHRDNGKKRMDIRSFVIWAAGFALYRFLMHVDIPVGNTLPDMVVTMLLCILNEKLFPSKAA